MKDHQNDDGHSTRVDTRERQKLVEYASERIARVRVRLLLYILGCSLGYLAVGFTAALAALIILLVGDAIDCLYLRRITRHQDQPFDHARARRGAILTGVIQGLSVGAATGIYFFLVDTEANILFVIGALGLGAVNSAIVLPKNPTVGLARLLIYAATPIVFLSVRSWQMGTLAGFHITDVSGAMLLLCMTYMFIAFTRSGLDNARITDALEQKGAELDSASLRMLRDQKELHRLSLVARKANDSVILSDRDRRILWVNEAFTRITGFTAEEAQGQLIVDLLTGPQHQLRGYSDIDHAVAAGQAFRGEMPIITKDIREVWVDVNLIPVHGDRGEVEFFIAIERDVTEARRHARELDAARIAAEEGARVKAEFLANMSHEIRTPLTGIIGMADLLAETPLSADQTHYAETIRGSSQSLVAIINDILDLSKLDAGKMEPSPVDFDARRCFEQVVALFENQADQKGLSLSLILAPNVPDLVHGDDTRLRQVATNIIGNALKFTETGGVAVRVWFDAKEGHGRLSFAVADTGIGIPDDKIDHIFDHFTQAETDTTRMFGGTGLGLAISRHIVDMLGGEISVVSHLGDGTTFTVSLPIEIATPKSASPVAFPTANPVDLAGLNVLIAEDNRTNRLLFSKYLGGLPITLNFAEDGGQAVDMVRDLAPDLVFMDMAMPRKSGLQATREIRSEGGPQPCIVALTAHAFDSERQACLQAGMNHFLTKPIRKQDLIDWIQAFQAERLADQMDTPKRNLQS